MISPFLQYYANVPYLESKAEENELLHKVAMCVSFWSRYLRNKYAIKRVNHGSRKVLKRSNVW